jgi:hypothetical protein
MRRPLAQAIPFARYRLIERIGRGGMATVYRAELPGPGGFARDVVVKLMLPQHADNPAFVEMFMNEAKLASRLVHPNIVQVHELGIVDGTVFIAMEYIDGIDLAELLVELTRRRERLPIEAACFIVRELCDALAYAHSATDAQGKPVHLVHRDVSPANVMIGRDGSVKLLDFGIATLLHEGATARTHTGSLKGKYGYMSPEQAAGKPIDHRIDIFAAGIVLHELLTGRRLFQGETELETLRRVADCDVPRPSELNREVPLALDAIVLQALARDPAERFATAQAMCDAIDELDLTGAVPRLMRARFAGHLVRFIPQPSDISAVSAAELRLSLGQKAALPASMAANAAANEVEVPLDFGQRRRWRRWTLALGLVAAVVLVWAWKVGKLHLTTAIAETSSPAPAPAPLPASAALPADPSEVSVMVDSVPEGAVVTLADGTILGKTPLAWKTRRSEHERIELALSLPGFRGARIESPLEHDTRVLVTLTSTQIAQASEPVAAGATPSSKPAIANKSAPRSEKVRAPKQSIDLKSGGLVDPFQEEP